MVSIAGLGSGLDTNSIIDQLVAVEQSKIDAVTQNKLARTSELTSWATIRDKLGTLSSSAFALYHASDWQSVTATSSDTNTVAVTTGAGSMSGALQFTVDALATGGIVRSTNVLPSLATKVAADQGILVSAAGKLGFASLASNDTVALGTHTIQVTQSSSAAIKLGTAALAASTVVSAANNTLQLTVNGATQTLTIASGTYDPTQMVAAIQAASDAAGMGVTYSLDPNGALKAATNGEGSSTSLRAQNTGSSILASLNWTADAQAITGTDGAVTVDGGAAQTFGAGSPIGPGATLALNVPGGGTITATVVNGLRSGTVTANNVSVGDGSLSAIVAAINAANAGVSATAVQVAANQYRLQLASNTSGAGSDPSIAASELDATNVGGFSTVTAGADAQITIGTGPGAYSITSSSNTMSGVLPGVTMTPKALSATPITVTVARDGNALADKVQKLVDAANGVKAAIDTATAYDAANKKASPLTGDSTARRVTQSLYGALAYTVAGSNPTSPGLAGVSVDKSGNFTFDRAKFVTAYTSDPDGMSRLFSRGGIATSGNVSFLAATDKTLEGTYAVNITTAAQQAFTSRAVPGNGTTVSARIGSVTASYTVGSGDTATTVAAGLNSAFATQNLQLVAAVNGGTVEIRTASYGSNSKMDVDWTGGGYTTYAGTDVAGTINGVAATGNGQILTAPQTDPTLAGLALKIVATSTGSLGTFQYVRGIAGRAAAMIAQATDSLTGYITSSETGIKAVQTLLDKQIADMQDSLTSYQNRLKAQFTALDTAMSQLKSQQAWLQAQLAGLTGN